MKEFKFLLFFSCLLILVFGCTNYKKHVLIRKANYYRVNYGLIFTKQDTIVIKKNLKLKYSDGKLSEVGKIKDDVKYSDWYFFSDSLKLKYVINYKKNKIDTLLRPFVLVNQSW